MGTLRITNPAVEPLTIAEAKAHCRVRPEHTDDDAYFQSLIIAARLAAEARTDRVIAKSKWSLTLDFFPRTIHLPKVRVLSIDSVEFYDRDGVLALLDETGYDLDNSSQFTNWLYPAAGYRWPDTRDHPNSVIVTMTSGFEDGAVSEDIKLWMKLAIGAWYDMRSGMDVAPLPMQAFELPPQFFQSLLDPWTAVTLV